MSLAFFLCSCTSGLGCCHTFCRGSIYSFYATKLPTSSQLPIVDGECHCRDARQIMAGGVTLLPIRACTASIGTMALSTPMAFADALTVWPTLYHRSPGGKRCQGVH
ncbi:hypothetical protein BC628DRAFT_269053 [Trametes gibbosa]|nr:hypothetical protein BC628DRAFT_269053 [Trametes gibbosa]